MVNEITEQTTHEGGEIIKKEKSSKETLVRWFSVIFVLLTIGVLIVVKWQRPDFPFKWIILIGIPLSVIGVVAFFSFSIYGKYQHYKEKAEKEEMPKAAPPEIIIKKLYDSVTNTNLRNHIKEYTHREYNINKNKIYVFCARLLYNDPSLGEFAYVIINANFIDTIPTIVSGKTQERTLRHWINMKSINPEAEPEVERVESFNPLTQTFMKTEKKTPIKKDISKTLHKSEDLA